MSTSMVRVIFVGQDGDEHIVQASERRSLMQAARDATLPFLIGECGGSCICATCHAYIDSRFSAWLPPISRNESNMLDAIHHARHNSRLTCQIPVTPQLEGIVVRIPSALD